MSEFAALETGYFRRMEAQKLAGESVEIDFGSVLQKINNLLENVEIVRPDEGAGDQQPFPVRLKGGGTTDRGFMSGGESELVALGCDIVSFPHRAGSQTWVDKTNILIIDEPDVHLHPDLQFRLMSLLINELASTSFKVIIATHSTSIVAALSEFSGARVAFMKIGDQTVQFQPVSDALRAVLPIFGAHPLSNVFNAKPILLVEGEDEERLWQQVVRTSNGSIKLWPCSVGGVGNLPTYEKTVNDIATAIYDSPRAYSLRDRDEAKTELEDLGITQRMRLNCRASENLLLTNNILQRRATSWKSLKEKLDAWVGRNSGHPNHVWMRGFQKQGYDRRNADLKEIRNILVAILGATRSWEVIVGQAIGSEALTEEPDSLGDYLGAKLRDVLKGRKV